MPKADESGWGWSEAGEEARCVQVRRLRARRKADRIVTERYHRGGTATEIPAPNSHAIITDSTDFSRLR